MGRGMPKLATPGPLAFCRGPGLPLAGDDRDRPGQVHCDLARKLKLDQSCVARTIRLASLAPDVTASILDGDEPEGLGLNLLRLDLPLLWKEQHDRSHLGRVP
jgi:hypothetical protein